MFIAKNGLFIVQAKNTLEELRQALRYVVYTSIEETDEEYKFYHGRFLTVDEILVELRQSKYNEANTKAKFFLESGNALYEFEEGKHVEATDGNIGKFTGYALGYVIGKLQPTDTVEWNTKEDETVYLTQEQVGNILDGLGRVQAYVWTVQFPAYVQAIQEATTIQEMEAIQIEYKSSPEEVTEDSNNEPEEGNNEPLVEPEISETEPIEDELEEPTQGESVANDSDEPSQEELEEGELEEEDFVLPFESAESEDE